MKKAFTLTEVIFVVVIIGILAGVAVPRLVATRDDALVSTMISQTKNIVNDFHYYYISHGGNIWRGSTVMDATDVPLFRPDCSVRVASTAPLAPNTFALCHRNTACVLFVTTLDGNLTVRNGSDGTDMICKSINQNSAIATLTAKPFRLGGESIRR